MIHELGDLLAEGERFSLTPQLTVADVDCDRILAERQRMQTFNDAAEAEGRPEDTFRTVPFRLRDARRNRGLIRPVRRFPFVPNRRERLDEDCRSEEHTSELQSLMRISYSVFCLKKKKTKH